MIESLLKEYQAKLEARFDILLPESGQLYDKVVTASRYSLLAGGKRIRPAILLEFYRLCGGEDDCAYQFAAALEMIHTYSLIHDDLPCMDDDDLRRGRPSCHKKFDEATALLAGDSLLTEAFSVAAKTVALPPQRVIKGISYLASAAGISGMIGGQIIDLDSENNPSVEIDAINEMYRLKTGALLRAAAVIGCILAGADDEHIDAAAAYGEKLGLAFQIIDDILDASADEVTLGKPIGSDEKNKKLTYVSYYGIDRCREIAKQLTLEAKQVLDVFEGDKTNILALTDYLLGRKN